MVRAELQKAQLNKSLLKSHCMQLECAPWQAVVPISAASGCVSRALAPKDQRCSSVQSWLFEGGPDLLVVKGELGKDQQ